MTARLVPFTVDGLIWAASMVVLDTSRRASRYHGWRVKLGCWGHGHGWRQSGARAGCGPIGALVSRLARVGPGWLLRAADDIDPHWARHAIARDLDIDRYKVKRIIDQAA